MMKGLVRDSLAYSFSNVISATVSLFLLPFFTRVLTPADYGVIDILQMFTAVVKVTVPLEIYQALARFYIDSRDDGARVAYASNALLVTAFNYAIFVAVSIAFARPLAALVLQSGDLGGVFSLCAVAIACNGVFFVLQLQSRYDFRPMSFLVSSIIFVTVSTSVTALSILVLHTGVRGMYYGQIAGAVLGAGFSFTASHSCYRPRIDFRRLRSMLAFSAPLIPSSLGVFLSSYIDRFAIQRMMSISDVGIYGIASRFSSITSLLLLGFASALNPLIYRHYREEGTPGKIARLFNIFLAVAISVSVFFLCFAREILAVFAAPAFQGAAGLIPILMASSFVSNMYLFNPGLPLQKKTGILSAINIAGAGVNIGLNFALVPRLGILGAALSSTSSALLRYILNYVFSRRHYPVRFAWGRIWWVLVVTGCVAALLVVGWRHGLATGVAPRIAVFAGVSTLCVLVLAGGELKAWARRRARGAGEGD